MIYIILPHTTFFMLREHPAGRLYLKFDSRSGRSVLIKMIFIQFSWSFFSLSSTTFTALRFRRAQLLPASTITMFFKFITIKKAFRKILHKSKKDVSPTASFPYTISNPLHLERHAFCYHHYCKGHYLDPRQGGGEYNYCPYQMYAHIP
jgi:hypothetical protein